ncbi:MAG: nickel-dependent lactate racemase [Proteocatella sp.]
MAEYIFKYGKGEIALNINEGNVIGQLHGNSKEAIENIGQELHKTLENPIDSLPLKDLIGSDENITLVISDMTRYWMRQDLVIPHIIDYLNQNGVKDEAITILIANGTHLPAPKSEIEMLVTKAIAERIKVVNHECESEELVYVGTTTRGTKVELNPLAVNQKTICLGAAAHHLMAGFGGGRKSILPGVASKKSINQNHIHALSPNEPCSNPLIGNNKLSGNPLNEDMCEAAAMVNPLFIINLAMNPQGKLCRIFSGNWMTSWLECCKYVDEMYKVEISKKADIVIAGCGGYPKDMSMYQSTKVVDNVEGAVKEGGTIILISECCEGGGPEEYFGWSKFLKTGDLDKQLRAAFNIPGYVFYQNCEVAERINLVLLSSIDKEKLAPMGITTFNTAEELLKNLDFENKDIYIIEKGGTVIPQLSTEKVT